MNKVDYRTKKDLVKKILGNKCSRCGDHEEDPNLQFNYIPSTKPKHTIYKYLSGDIQILLTEINNYRLLCIGCCYVETGHFPDHLGSDYLEHRKVGSWESIEVISNSYDVERDDK
jgi:hypothetical protein